MLLSALVIGALALYYFGLRAAAWAAGSTLVLCLVALFAPRWATAIHAFVAAGAIAIYMIGRKRPRPPDAVFAVRLARGAVKRGWQTVRALWGGRSDDER